SKDGDLGTIGNEPSNTLCFEAPYKIIGHVQLPDEKILIFSTDNTNSEIGIGDPVACTYETVLNKKCLNFFEQHPIKGWAKKIFQKGIKATFTANFILLRRITQKNLDID